jgi:hypothetical protein
MPPDLGGIPWARLSLADIDSFLAVEPEETLYWEAKADGREPLGSHAIAKAVCGFANSERGGYLILGAKRSDRGFVMSGLTRPPAGELGAWVDQVVRSGAVRPLPWFEPRTFTARPGAAIVAIDPVEQPPCVTSGGAVYERTSGRTVPVAEPNELARLFAKGRAARVQRVIEGIDGLVEEANAARRALFEDPPRPSTGPEAEQLLNEWLQKVLEVLDRELPGRRAGFLADLTSPVTYGGPVWRSNVVRWLDARVGRLVSFQQELARRN